MILAPCPDSPARIRRNAKVPALLAGWLAGARATGICLGAGPLESGRVPALSSEAFVDWVFALTLPLASDVADQHL
jgi:hypothetical protein